jgi:hypothetical protein
MIQYLIQFDCDPDHKAWNWWLEFLHSSVNEGWTVTDAGITIAFLASRAEFSVPHDLVALVEQQLVNYKAGDFAQAKDGTIKKEKGLEIMRLIRSREFTSQKLEESKFQRLIKIAPTSTSSKRFHSQESTFGTSGRRKRTRISKRHGGDMMVHLGQGKLCEGS